MLRTVLILIGLFLGLFVLAYQADRRAEAEARAFCDSIAPGSPFIEAVEIAKKAGEDRLRFIEKDSISVGFTGVPPFSRHFCEIRRAGENVGEKKYLYLD